MTTNRRCVCGSQMEAYRSVTPDNQNIFVRWLCTSCLRRASEMEPNPLFVPIYHDDRKRRYRFQVKDSDALL